MPSYAKQEVFDISRFFECSAGEEPTAVRGMMTCTDNGFVLQLYGGTHEHVGSVTVSTTAATIRNPERKRATSSVINLPPHMDELVARPAAERLALLFDAPVVCIAGLHIDNATQEEIETMVKNAEAVVEKLIVKIKAEGEAIFCQTRNG
jgi:hypothetical protein